MCNRIGFSLLELLVALTIIALLSTVIMPNLQKATPRYEREQFIARINALTQLAWQQAIVTRKNYKVVFSLSDRRAWIERDTQTVNRSGEQVFVPVIGQAVASSFVWDPQFEVRSFVIEGYDEMKRYAGRKTAEVHFFVVPDGMTQEVTINFVDTKGTLNNRPRQVGLVLNPFNAQFKVYDAFQA